MPHYRRMHHRLAHHRLMHSRSVVDTKERENDELDLGLLF
jgi:hypothetical protein